MDSKENKLSNYIDSLNDERKPKEHSRELETDEMSELFETVRKVRSLKASTFPEGNYSKTLANNINRKFYPRTRRRWFYGAATAVAAVAFIVAINMSVPFNKNNLAYAMEQAYKGVKAYHGILKVVETNAEGKSDTQSEVEVWADKEGHYYVKGLEGWQKGLVTVNDGEKKWQIQPQEKEVDVFAAFPDPYSFTFNLGNEIEDVKSAVKTKVVGEDTILGRTTIVMEVMPQGGNPYKLWVDKETRMPLQKQTTMENSLQYKVYYENIDYTEAIPKNILNYKLPQGFKEVNTNTDQIVNTLDEAADIVGFKPKVIVNLPTDYSKSSIAVISKSNSIKTNYTSQDNSKKISLLQKEVSEEFKPASMAILGKINNNIAEIQSPIQSDSRVIEGGGTYGGVTGLSSVRWQENGMEYTVVGNVSVEELSTFIKALTNESVELLPKDEGITDKPQVEVPVDLEAEKGDQKSVDAGHSPWKLDPVFVSQVFVSLKISPQGIVGDYPIKYEDIKVLKNTGKDSVVEVNGDNTPIRRVYLKKLIRQDSTGIWTVVGYDPVK